MLASLAPTWPVRGGEKREFGFHKQCATAFLQEEARAVRIHAKRARTIHLERGSD
jgi:hypothetical protein